MKFDDGQDDHVPSDVDEDGDADCGISEMGACLKC
jgi:hypothetical protein